MFDNDNDGFGLIFFHSPFTQFTSKYCSKTHTHIYHCLFKQEKSYIRIVEWIES